MDIRIKNQVSPVRAYWIARANLFRQNALYCSNCGFQAEEASSRCPECDAHMEESAFGLEWLGDAEPADMMFAD